MPELPEVETYRRFIDALAVGQTIAAVQVNDAHVLATPEDQLRAGLVGRTISGTSRLGKNCFLELDNGQVLVLHFGMTGDVGAYRDEPDAPRFTRVALHLEDSGLRLAFIDPRKFGRIRLADSAAAHQKAKKIGPDALDISAVELHQKLARRKTLLKPLLLDQSITAGLGNWIVDEVLFQAKIHPERLGATLTEKEGQALHAAVQAGAQHRHQSGGQLSLFSGFLPHSCPRVGHFRDARQRRCAHLLPAPSQGENRQILRGRPGHLHLPKVPAHACCQKLS
ncbi:Fpg/Nei family DNA glycosylase [Hymenobacter humi]|uniref:Fpg/Nei family DNA glycosylase n=1 Tax=Hymenobacter humi TaxID=1411620 RepID=A0ABW2U8M3_9BACT